MSSQYLNLGWATFVSNKASTLVKIRATAVLHSQIDKHLDVTLGKLHHQLTICEDIWICKSHDFRLSVATSTDPDTTHLTGIGTTQLEDIGKTLQQAQVQFLADVWSGD